MNILLINLPYYGHVVPTIGLVQELVRRGCTVTYLLPYGWEDKIAGSGAVFCGYQNHRQLAEQMKNAYLAADQIADQFDYVIYEQFFFLGKHLAELHGKPSARIFTAPAANERLMHAYLDANGSLSIFRNRWIGRAFTKDIVKEIEKRTGNRIPMKCDNWLDEIVHNPPERNLVYTLSEFQPYVDEFSKEKYMFLGPSVYDRREEPFSYQKQENPMIYISLGTVFKGKTKFFRMCMEAFRGEAVDVIMSVGDPAVIRKLKDIPSNVHVYPFVPQLHVLRQADVFVTHGGMNSISEALVSGTPMLVVPISSDQPVNAERVEELGAGKRIDFKDVSSERLKKDVLELLHERNVRKKLSEIQVLIAHAPGNEGGAQWILEHGKAVDQI